MCIFDVGFADFEDFILFVEFEGVFVESVEEDELLGGFKVEGLYFFLYYIRNHLNDNTILILLLFIYKGKFILILYHI